MSDRLRKLVNTMLFMLNRQEFHRHQINSEKARLLKSIDKSAPGYRKLEHLTLIREYHYLLAESTWFLLRQQRKLKEYMDRNPHLNNLELYQQADKVLKEMLF